MWGQETVPKPGGTIIPLQIIYWLYKYLDRIVAIFDQFPDFEKRGIFAERGGSKSENKVKNFTVFKGFLLTGFNTFFPLPITTTDVLKNAIEG